MINTELLRLTLKHIEETPELWVQREWATPTECGTAYCFAGWAAVLSGATFTTSWNVIPPGTDQPRDVDYYAAEILGIEHTRGPSCCARCGNDGEIPLFEAHNTLGDLREIVARLIEEAEAS
jgi:hypothetical protein